MRVRYPFPWPRIQVLGHAHGPAGAAGCGAGSLMVGRADVFGAGGVADVLVAVRAAPEVGAGFEGGVGPAAVGLGPVVSAAQCCQVAGAGRTCTVVRDGVVAVAAPGWSGAPREDAALVADGDGPAMPLRHGR